MRWLIFFFCSVLCAGCSLPLVQKNEAVLASGQAQSQLFTIRIKRWDTQKFSGLLALRDRPLGLSYVLLDTTGMKLLEGEIFKDGGHAYVPPTGVLQESVLAGFFAQSLERIFLSEPLQKPCSSNWLLQLCSEEKKGSMSRKTARFWPFTLWQTDIEEMGDGKGRMILYSQPWLGVRIFLKTLNQH